MLLRSERVKTEKANGCVLRKATGDLQENGFRRVEAADLDLKVKIW